ncbi:MAG: hypothetical protein HN975_01975 [Anaerolineae bacterium]|jgi:hypothetical protein|nr:hypothetical protein [Anaerolineae bacterium]
MTIKPEPFGFKTFSVYNNTDEMIPSYAVMQINDIVDRNGKAIRIVGKPDLTIQATQNSTLLAINSSIRIPPNNYGIGSQDWPVPVLYDDELTPGMACGPSADSWAVNTGGSAFIWQGVDPTNTNIEIQSGFISISGAVNLAGFITTEDHPGKGILFVVNAGVWDSTAHEWGYDDSTEFKAVDNRVGVPHPKFPATGTGVWRPSVEHGSIIEILDLDCVGEAEEPIS